jgi:BTB/POZ domain
MYSEKFCLQWNDHSKILVSLLHEFLGKESLLDVTLAAEGHLLRVHRLILCACSPYFEASDHFWTYIVNSFILNILCTQAMLSNESEKHAIVYMKDVKFDDLKALVNFMYKGEVTVVQEQLASFMSTAESLQIKGLFAIHLFK